MLGGLFAAGTRFPLAAFSHWTGLQPAAVAPGWAAVRPGPPVHNANAGGLCVHAHSGTSCRLVRCLCGRRASPKGTVRKSPRMPPTRRCPPHRWVLVSGTFIRVRALHDRLRRVSASPSVSGKVERPAGAHTHWRVFRAGTPPSPYALVRTDGPAAPLPDLPGGATVSDRTRRLLTSAGGFLSVRTKQGCAT
jgi:hypothetical protein